MFIYEFKHQNGKNQHFASYSERFDIKMQIICMHLRQSINKSSLRNKLLYAFEIVKKTGLFIWSLDANACNYLHFGISKPSKSRRNGRLAEMDVKKEPPPRINCLEQDDIIIFLRIKLDFFRYQFSIVVVTFWRQMNNVYSTIVHM